MLRHRHPVIAVAGQRKGGISQRKGHATMAGIMAVGMVGLNAHRHPRRARADLFEHHAEPTPRIVVFPHDRRRALGPLLR